MRDWEIILSMNNEGGEHFIYDAVDGDVDV